MKKTQLLITLLITFSGIHLRAQEWSLQQCIDSAIINNKKIKISQNNETISIEKRKEIHANLIPKLSLNGDYKYYFDLPTQLMPLSAFGGPEGQFNAVQFGVEHNINANIQLNMPIYQPELYGGMKASKIGTQATGLQTEVTKEEIILEVSNLYYAAQVIKNQQIFIDSNIANTQILYEHVQLFYSQQMLTQSDVDKVELQQQQLLLLKHNLENKYTQVIMGINLMIGMPLDHHFDVESSVVKINLVDYSLQKPLNLRLLEAKNSLVENEIRTLNRSRFLPSAFIYGSYGTMGYGYDRKPNDFLNFYTMGFAGLKVTYPLFNGTTTLRKVNQKKLELKNYALQKELINDQTSLQIEKATMQRTIAEESIITNEKQVELALKIYRNTVLQHKQGTVNLTEVILADNKVREAQQNYLSALIDYLKADLSLKQFSGNIQQ